MTELAVVDTRTGEYIPAGEWTLELCASHARESLASNEKNNWQLGEVLSIARALCDAPDCGIEGDNPNERYGQWVSDNLSQTSSANHLLRIRRMHEVFGHRREKVERLPQTGLYELAQPQCDEIREEAIDRLLAIPGGKKIPLAAVRCEIDTSLKALPHVSRNSGENEWYTPVEFIEAARKVMGGIDLDPASSETANKTVCATKYYAEENDGLKQDWFGRIWMNPPYAQPLIKYFSDRLCTAIDSKGIEQAIVLVNNATETDWFQGMAARATAICFTNKRIKFLDPDGNPGAPLQGQAALYFGENLERFISEYSAFGFVVCHA